MKRNKWSQEDQTLFLKMTGELLLRGYPLSGALESVMYHLPKNHKEEIKDSLIDLKEGYPFYLILRKLQFEEYLIGYVFFAEKHGGLATAFIESSRIIQKRAKDLSKVKKMFSYPLFLFVITILLFIFVEKYLLPRFSSLFTSMDIEANFFTNVIYFFGRITPYLFYLFFILVLLFLSFLTMKYRKLPPIIQKTLLVKIPIIGNFLRMFYTHYFSAQLSYLLSGGLSVHEALSIFEENEGQPFYKQIGNEMKRLLKTGEKLENIMGTFPFFERELAIIVKHGQDNGKLSQELMFFSTQCLYALEDKTEKLMKKTQPIFYLLIGLMVISMYLAVLLPMFHLLEGI